ncbi:MAG: hypothetical protein J0H82_26530 [Alphaproteobacteria bacterium]|jgi:hypothetical protein|nr:hypothetical protein [Alphaproteobacteria bacterium]
MVSRLDDQGSESADSDQAAWRERIGAFVIAFSELEALMLSYVEEQCAGGMDLARQIVAKWPWPGRAPDPAKVRSLSRLSRMTAGEIFALAAAIALRLRARHARRCLEHLGGRTGDRAAGAADPSSPEGGGERGYGDAAVQAYAEFHVAAAWCQWTERADRLREIRNEILHRLCVPAGRDDDGRDRIGRRRIVFMPPAALTDVTADLLQLIDEIERGPGGPGNPPDTGALRAAIAAEEGMHGFGPPLIARRAWLAAPTGQM